MYLLALDAHHTLLKVLIFGLLRFANPLQHLQRHHILHTWQPWQGDSPTILTALQWMLHLRLKILISAHWRRKKIPGCRWNYSADFSIRQFEIIKYEGLKAGVFSPVPGDLQIYLQSSALTLSKHTYLVLLIILISCFSCVWSVQLELKFAGTGLDTPGLNRLSRWR